METETNYPWSKYYNKTFVSAPILSPHLIISRTWLSQITDRLNQVTTHAGNQSPQDLLAVVVELQKCLAGTLPREFEPGIPDSEPLQNA